jgi:hypothetical protein
MSKTEMRTRGELAMMGIVQPTSNDEVQEMTKYIMKSLERDPETLGDILKNAICKYHDNKVKFITTYRIYGMPCICYLLDSGVSKNDEEYFPAPFEEDYGTGYPCAFCYVLNLESDWCSEFGDVFFKKTPLGYKLAK